MAAIHCSSTSTEWARSRLNVLASPAAHWAQGGCRRPVSSQAVAQLPSRQNCSAAAINSRVWSRATSGLLS
eukprot:3524321-Lingulodinium_polyedra.AAC.2